MTANPQQHDNDEPSAIPPNRPTPSPLPRWLYLLRYHQPSQLLRRLRNVGRNRWLKKFGATSYLQTQLAQNSVRDNHAFAKILDSKLTERRLHRAQQSADRIMAGEFCFLQQSMMFPKEIDWRLAQHANFDALWRFHLHYQEYLLDLAAADEQSESIDFTAKAWEIVLHWIENNQPSDGRVFGDAWHPFCISRRLPVWFLLWTADLPPANQRDLVLTSIVSQANFLADHLETDLGGNHLLENLRALGLAACFLQGPEANRWLDIVRHHLPQELAEQVTVHGEHFERSPMYHAFMLEAILDLRDATASVDLSLATTTGEAATRMGKFLRLLLHPDGEIPLLSDSSLDSAPPASLLLDRVDTSSDDQQTDGSSKQDQSKHSGGYWTFRADQDFLLFDAAPACPDHLPAHAHADLLNIEASLNGQRVFVDTGVYDYAAGQMRQHCRGTAAHNVLQIEAADQFDIWSRFRMGYRGWPQQLETGQEQDFHWARATHNAYRRLIIPTVGRWLACRPQGPWLCLDWAQGQGQHRLTQRLHLHPEVNATQTAENNFNIEVNGQCYELLTLGSSTANLEKGWYCPKFGNRLPIDVITWQTEDSLPATLGWALKWPDQFGSVMLNLDQAHDPALSWHDNQTSLNWRPRSDDHQL